MISTVDDHDFILTYIIPFFKGDACVQTCLDSIFAIGLNENQLEVLVVDDCSPTVASDVLRSYALEHPNLRIIRHERNTRQGGAKNTGIKEAKGKFVAFADQDDVVLSANVRDAVSLLCDEEELDVLSCRWEMKRTGEDAVELGIDPPTGYLANGVRFCEDYVDPRVSFGPWSYFYRREYLYSQSHPMAENVLMEDADWIAWHLFHAERVAFFEKPIYRWNYRTDSTSHGKNHQTKIAWIALGIRIIDCCEEYRRQSEVFAGRMYDNGLYDIDLQFSTLWGIDDCNTFFKVLKEEKLLERLAELPLSKKTKRIIESPRLYSAWFRLYKPVRLLGHRLKLMFRSEYE